MNIRQRIILLIALVFGALALIGGYAVYQSRSNSAEVRVVTEQVVPSTLKSTELMVRLQEVQIAALGLVAAPDADTTQQLLGELNGKKEVLQKLFADQLQQADSDAQRGLIKEAQESLRNYFDSINDTAKFKLAGQKEMAEANMGATVEQYLREQGQMIEAVQVEKRRSKDAAIASLNQRLTSTSATLTAISLLAVLGLGVIGWLLYRQIVFPIAEMEGKMTEIATSQDFTHRLSVTRRDEIGRSMLAFNAMVEKIEESTALVKQKAADIHAMLQYIPQGILTVEAEGLVHPEYSDHLRAILETEDIARRPVMTLVFEQTELGADALSQIEAALQACIGEDEMNFEFNAHLLPAEVSLAMADGRRKILDLSWAPITDEHGNIQRLMLCLRDVTELRALARAASAQKRELEIIGEILAVQHEKFHAFIEGSTSFLAENEAAIDHAHRAQAHERGDTVKLLFRNMHTIKGNARTYGLRQLTDVVHHSEQHYDALRSGQAQWSTEELLLDIAAVRSVLEEYTQINAVKLGRTGPGRRGDAEKFVMVARHDVQAMLERLDSGEAAGQPALGDAVHEVRETLRAAGTERLAQLLQGVTDSLPALAHELGKEPPQLAIDDHGLRIHTQFAGPLRNAFMHMFRNSMDHGIEAALERIAHGKPAAGSIRLHAELDAERLLLTLSDDGKGLNLAAIRERAVQRGLIADAASVNDEEAAELIFAAGFSTAASVTDVSGRGVGMDAVRGFVESDGGSIAIALHGRPGDASRPFALLVTLPARAAIRSRVLKAVAA
ncbi:HAMP domain-containing protein [Xylophilus rhododendri]|uniref:Chemotaxis protein CheA n=1 Tax=Xylophilus rhododendri TaxID=2697032 RepID=A0A857J3K9_9BURK|nr:MCP four helix bundle domain-containing protein [Xylophilus rhododendri]QHI97445.1 HAMP domain-containing protein [Xylophilus rhododendri]